MMRDVQYSFLSNQQYCVFGDRGCNHVLLNIYETADYLMIVSELSGADPNTLEIDIDSDVVHVRGIRQIQAPEQLVRIHRLEIGAGPFEFDVPVKVAVDITKATSRYHNGLLEIILPLAKATSQRIVINVQEGDTQ